MKRETKKESDFAPMVRHFRRINPELQNLPPLRKDLVPRLVKMLVEALGTAAVLAVFFNSCPAFASPSYAQIAAKYIGKGEQGADNAGPWVRKFLRDDRRMPWCAGFVSHVLEEGGYNGPYRRAARSFLKAGKIVKVPVAGDLIVFSRGLNAGHVGIVEKVEGGFVHYIDGNSGKFPAKVSRHKATLGKVRNFLGYVRVK